MKKSIAIDMDDTVADTLDRHLTWYKSEFGISLERSDLIGKKIYDVVPEHHLSTVRSFPTHPDFFRDLKVIDNAIEVIYELSQRYEIYFVSAAMEYPPSFNAKYEWLKRHFSFISDMNYVFCGFKGVFNCDYLIDDSSRHLDAFSGQGYLFTSESNAHVSGYERINSWLEAKELLG
ncbi:5'-3'-deoxyribonucleotidase [Marinimicrobium sp. ABcell2]|uniref:5' nucleotidase, NT5C type n=1 Tax=Marinimicrobium sp. ABcell2 TaxID=3069751 RepID=UPI0027B094D2|nr:5'-3'-deoxyribonucleotidase [Marinimicrobium sp. ABcell2]MDQ2076766.1 5'-3'-deoxyribonucleotidase [Marinimicrobium sp. ABcell2]